MIVDRRLVAAVALAAAVALVLGIATAGRTRHDPTTTTNIVAEVTPATPAATAGISVASVPAVRPVSGPEPAPPPGSAPAPTMPTNADVDELVQARRPVPDPATLSVDDGDGHVHADHSTASAGDVAAATAVAMWSWRFDDPPARLADALTGVATPDVIAALAPASTELDRRRVAGEVAWAIVTPEPAAANPAEPGDVVVVVTGSQHVTTATTAEAVVARAASLRLRAVAGGWQVVDVVLQQ